MQHRPIRASVIVPVRDNARGVRDLLRCLEMQTVPRGSFEVIVADDGSQVDPVRNLDTDEGLIKLIRTAPSTSYAARNCAAAIARGDVLAFCDSDCRPDPEWLENGLAATAGADIVAGEVVFIVPERMTIWSLLTIDNYLDQRRGVNSGVAATANLFVSKEIFDRVGRFDESLPSGGDWEFVRRARSMGARLAYEQGAIVRHPTLDTAGAFLRKVWRVNRWAETRRMRDGLAWYEGRGGLGAALVPFYGMALHRRSSERSLTSLELDRLSAIGVSAPRGKEVLAIATLYVLVALTVRLSQLHARLTSVQSLLPVRFTTGQPE